MQLDDLTPFRIQDVLAMYDFDAEAMVWIKDRDLRYRWANRSFLLNFSFPDIRHLIGKSDRDFAPAYLVDLYNADDASVLSGATIVARVEPVGTLEAIPTWNQTWKRPLRNERGRIIGALGLTRRLPHATSPSFPFPELVPVLEQMQLHCAKDMNNHALAALANLSVRAFERKFKKHFQMTPNQFLSRLRITRAAADLCNSHDTITEIALHHGFSDQSHFTREFRKHFGNTPRVYRTLHQ